MSSREIAELTGKQHNHVIADCDKLNENYREMRLAELSADLYADSYGRQQKCYDLKRKQTYALITGYSVELLLSKRKHDFTLSINFGKIISNLPRSLSCSN